MQDSCNTGNYQGNFYEIWITFTQVFSGKIMPRKIKQLNAKTIENLIHFLPLEMKVRMYKILTNLEDFKIRVKWQFSF